MRVILIEVILGCVLVILIKRFSVVGFVIEYEVVYEEKWEFSVKTVIV